MSIASVTGRIQELELMIAPRPVTPAAGGQTFVSQLAAAQAPAAQAGFGTTAAAPAAGGGATAYDDLIAQSAQRNGVDPALLKGLIRQESNFDPNAGSGAGARGLTQLMPGTASSLGVSDVTDPAQSIEAGARYLRKQLDSFGGSVPLALAAYNAGPGAVQRYGGVPPYAETQDYVRQVQAYADGYRAAGQTPAAAALPAMAATAPAAASASLPYSVV